MKRLGLKACLGGALMALAACGGDNSSGEAAGGGDNPLLGTWELVPNDRCLLTRIVFESDSRTETRTRFGGDPPSVETIGNSYRVSGDRVYLSTGTMEGSYTVLGPDRIQNSEDANCTYTRVG